MKPTQITELIANIKHTFVSFFSILMFVALGVAVFLGISWASPALEDAADSMFNEGAYHNFQIQYPYGLTQDDLQELSDIEGVSEVEAERQSFQTLCMGDRKYTVKVQSLGQSIDVPIVVEGELPTASNEIAFHAESARVLGVNVGDVITFDKDNPEAVYTDSENSSGMLYLVRDSFTVSAIVDNADYIAKSSGTYGYSTAPSGRVDALAWVDVRVFDASAFQNGYPVVNVRCDGLDGMNSFGDDYKNASNEIKEPIEALGSTLAAARYDYLHDQVQKQVDEGQAKIDEGEAKIAQGKADIADGEEKLEAGRAELERKRTEGQAKLNDAYAALMDGEAKKADAERELNDASAKVNEGQAKIDEADAAIAEANAAVSDAESYKAKCDKDLASGKITQKEYDKRLDDKGSEVYKRLQPLAKKSGMDIPMITHENYSQALAVAHAVLSNTDELKVTVDGKEMTLGEARKLLESSKKKLADAQSQYDAKVAELNSGWNEYYAGVSTYESEVADGEQKLADGAAKIEEAKQQVADAEMQVEANRPMLESARESLEQMKKYDWTVSPRSYNSGAVEVSTFCGVTNSLSISMAALFIIVGLLVSYFAVSRIVHEQVMQIGTKKALGFRKGEITASFLWYSGIAVVAGAIVGAIMAFFLVEGIIGGVIGSLFAFGAYPAYFGWGLFLIIALVELVLVLGATYLACRKILKQHAVELLRGDKPPEGKAHFYEKWGIWDKLPLFVQTIVNNCVNDKRRLLSTIVGVAGCTALIVTAITLNNDVMKSYDRQYREVYGFNAITYADAEPEYAADSLETALESEGFPSVQVLAKGYLMVQPNGESGAMNVIVPFDGEAFAQLYHVNPKTDGALDLSAEGAWVTQAYAEHLGAKVGDVITIDGGDGKKHEIPILGFYEFWLTYNEMVMGKDYYEKEFGEASPNAVYSQTGDTAVADAELAINGVDGFYSIVDDAALQHGNFESFSAVSNAVVIIYLVLAALMAIVVLLNLNVMFIAEKKRELIVLMINGFSVKDARHYISYDTIVLTALGIVAGILLGCIMGSITVASIEPVTGVFLKDVDGLAVLIGILGSAILAVIMCLIALRRINKFELTDINRF